MLPGKRYTPEDALRLVWRRKWLLVAPFVISSVATIVALRYVPDLYRSETLILVVPQRVPDSYVRATVTARIEDRLQSISQQILSRSRLEPIISEFGLYPEQRAATPMEDVVNKMRLDIKAEPVRGDAFRVSYESEDPTLAQKVTERLASLFIEENLRDREVLADATSQFLESQLVEARDRLIKHEKMLEAYRLRHAGELPTQAQSSMQSLQMLQSQAQGLTDSVARDRDRRLILERQLSEVQRQNRVGSSEAGQAAGGPAPAPPSLDDLPQGSAERQLTVARQVLQALETRLKPEHPDVVRAKRAIQELEVKAREEQRARADAASASVDDLAGGGSRSGAAERGETAAGELRDELTVISREITNKERQLARVQTDIDTIRGQLSAMPTRESEMTELMRDYETLRSIYTDLLAKRESSKVAADLERRQIGEQFRVIDPARKPEVPFSPNRPLYTAAGALLGLGLGVALIAMLEIRDTTFHRDDDVVGALGLPVLAVVPQMMTALERRRRRRRALAVSVAVVLSGVGAAALVASRLLQ